MSQTKLVVLLMAVSLSLVAQSDPPGRVGRLGYSHGPVSFQPAGMTDWVDANANRPLTTDDQVWVGEGARAEIHVGSTALRLDSNTAFQFLNLDDQTIQVQLSQGTLTVRVRNLAPDQIIEFDTPNLAFNVLRPGEYRISADPDSQTTRVTVRQGEGEVTGGGETFPVHARQQAIVVGGDQVTYDLVSAPGADGWDQWNASRDRREDESVSARYVSREMGGYSDLDQYGSWASQPGYGHVWMPTTVAAGWAPYHDGHWAWIAPWGWTWVDDAPWGFAPYHYGRWASFGGRWGWVPGPYGVTPLYAPALVGWIGGGSGFSLSFSFGSAAAIGWFPLGPREPYFPSYHVSSGYFGRVNHTNTVIASTTINRYYNHSRNPNNPAFNNIRYANQTVPNAVIAVPQDRFASGRRVRENARAVPGAQLGAARLVVAPEIAPRRESVLGPRAAEASRAPRPPASALKRPVVARTAPPPATVPFERQQAGLNRNPGRPLPIATVQQMRQNAPARTTPVRVQDMSRVRRVQPVVGAAPQPAARQANPDPRRSAPRRSVQPGVQQPTAAAPPPAAINRPSAPPSNANRGRQPNAPQPNVVQQPTAAAPPPAAVNRPSAPSSNANRGRQPNAPRPDVVQQPSAAPPPAAMNRPSAPPPVAARPDAPQPSAAPPPAAINRQGAPPSNANRGRQPEQRARAASPAQANRPQAQVSPQQPAQQVKQAPVERPEPASRSRGSKGKPEKDDKKN